MNDRFSGSFELSRIKFVERRQFRLWTAEMVSVVLGDVMLAPHAGKVFPSDRAGRPCFVSSHKSQTVALSR